MVTPCDVTHVAHLAIIGQFSLRSNKDGGMIVLYKFTAGSPFYQGTLLNYNKSLSTGLTSQKETRWRPHEMLFTVVLYCNYAIAVEHFIANKGP